MSLQGFKVENSVVKYDYNALDNLPSINNILRNFASSYTRSIYNVGDYVLYEQKLYKCNTKITTGQAWTPQHWTEVVFADQVKSIRNQTSDSISNVVASEYDTSASYGVGGFCIHNDDLYKCTVAIIGGQAWNANHWTKVQIADQVEQTNNNIIEFINNIAAEAYDRTAAYSVNDYCFYNGGLYKCTVAILGGQVWNPAHWTKTVFADQIKRIDTSLNQAGMAADSKAVGDAIDDVKDLITQDFDPFKVYKTGQYCYHNGQIYKCLVDMTNAEAWIDAHWELTRIMDQVNNGNDNLASEYSLYETYQIGDYCMRGGKLYKCVTPISVVEIWTPSHWQEAVLADDMVKIDDSLSQTGKAADAKAVGDALNAVDQEVDELKSDLDEYSNQIILIKNLVPSIYGGQYWSNVNNVVSRYDSDTKACIEIDVNGGESYSVNRAFSGNFSFWAYEENGTFKMISKITTASNYVCVAPQNATKMLLSNTGWDNDTDLVVLQTEESIIGYTKDEYPFNEIVGVKIENLESPNISSIEQRTDTLEDKTLELEYRSNVLMTNSSEIKLDYVWEQGNINTKTGQNVNDSTACRTVGYLKGAGMYVIKANSFKTYINVYDLNGVRVSGANWGKTKTNLYSLDDSHMIRVVVKKTDDSVFTPFDVLTDIVVQATISRVKPKNVNCAFMCHQGFSYDGKSTNNSRLQGFKEASIRGFDWAETDLELTSDGVLVCCHDESFTDATTGITYVIAEHTLAELKACDYYGSTIATLEEVLTVCKKYGLKLGLDQVISAWIDNVFAIARKLSMLDNIAWFVTVGASGLATNILNKDPKATIFVLSSSATLAEHVSFANGLCNGQNKVYAYPPYNIGTPEQFGNEANELHRDALFAIWTVDNLETAINYMPYVSLISSNKINYSDVCSQLNNQLA